MGQERIKTAYIGGFNIRMTNKILIHNIPVIDGSPTWQGELLMEMIHDALVGTCWHRPHLLTKRGASQGMMRCNKCMGVFNFDNPGYRAKSTNLDNPQYLTSLDALTPLWEKLSDDDRQGFVYVIEHILTRDSTWFYEAKPHQLVEALATIIEVECGCENGELQCFKQINCKDCVDSYKDCRDRSYTCPKCQGTGKRPLIDVWAEKCEVKG